MKTIFKLLKLQIDNKTDLLKTARPKTMAAAIGKVLLLLALLTFGVSLALSKVFNVGFNINAELVSVVLLVTQLLSVVFAIGSVINTLYLCNDNEMLFCLPITPNQLFISKLLMIYLRELAVNSAILAPILLTLGSFSSFGVSFYLSIPVLLLLLPVFPIVIAAFLSVPIMGIIRFLKRHTLISILVIFGLVATVLWGYVTLIGGFASDFDIAGNQIETASKVNGAIFRFGQVNYLYIHLARAMLDFSLWHAFALFLLVSVAMAALTVLFTRRLFFKIAMTSIEKTVKVKKREKHFVRRSVFSSLFRKELLCVFRSSTDVFEYFLFTLLMPFIVFSYDRLLMSITVNQYGTNMIAGAHVMVVAILAMLSNISSASAVSRDGGNFYTSKIVPVSYFAQMTVKFCFNAVFTVGAVLVTAVISLFTYPAWQVLLGSLAISMAAIGHIAYCIDSDVHYPTVNLQGDEKAGTVSKSTPKALIYGLVIGFLMGLTVILMSSMENQLIPYLLLIGAAFVFMLYRVWFMILRIQSRYDKIEM